MKECNNKRGTTTVIEDENEDNYTVSSSKRNSLKRTSITNNSSKKKDIKSDEKDSSIITLQICESIGDKVNDSEIEEDDYFNNIQPREKSKSEFPIKHKKVIFSGDDYEDQKHQLRCFSPGADTNKKTKDNLRVLFQSENSKSSLHSKELGQTKTS